MTSESKTLAKQVIGISELAVEKDTRTNLEPRALQPGRVIYRFLEPSLRSLATVGVSSVN